MRNFVAYTLLCAILRILLSEGIDDCYENHGTGKNLALNQDAYQISTDGRFNGADDAVKGGHAHRIPFCTKTNSESRPWWIVDLGERVPVSTVVIVNRDAGDGPGSEARLNNVSVRVGDTFNETSFNPETFSECAYEAQPFGEGEMRYLHCGTTLIGRYVTVYLKHTGILTVCEVEVYSEQVYPNEQWICALSDRMGPESSNNMARSKAVDTPFANLSERLVPVDGKLTHDAASDCYTGEWMVIDLGDIVDVIGVAVTTMFATHDRRLTKIYIRVGLSVSTSEFDSLPVCAHHCVYQGAIRFYYTCIHIIPGRYVVLTKNNEMPICEVEVYGTNIVDDNIVVESGCRSKPAILQRLLFDRDVNTCVNLKPIWSYSRKITFQVSWNTTLLRQPRKTYHYAECSSKFYVNFTYVANDGDLRALAFTGPIEDQGQGVGNIRLYRACREDVGHVDGLLHRQRYICTCDTPCNVYARIYAVNHHANTELCELSFFQ